MKAADEKYGQIFDKHLHVGKAGVDERQLDTAALHRRATIIQMLLNAGHRHRNQPRRRRISRI